MDKFRHDKTSNHFFAILAVLGAVMLVMSVIVGLMVIDVASKDVPNVDQPVETTVVEQ